MDKLLRTARKCGDSSALATPVDNPVYNDNGLRIAARTIPALRMTPYVVVGLLLTGTLGCRSPSDKVAKEGASGDPRVVCLTPSSTELVAAVAGAGVIVGVDNYSDYPPEVKQLPKVGDFVSPHFEAILQLQPDLVVLDEDQERLVAESLHNVGIRTLAMRMETTGDVVQGLEQVGEALGRPDEARRVIETLQRDLDEVRALADRARGDGPRRKVLFVVDRELGGLGNMVAAGPDTYINEMIALAGGDNVLEDSPIRFPRISAETVLTRAPEVILDAVHTSSVKRAVTDWNALSGVPAIANGQVHVLGETMHTHPSPRLGRTLRRIVELLYGL